MLDSSLAPPLLSIAVEAIERILETVHTEIGRIANDFGIKIGNPKCIEAHLFTGPEGGYQISASVGLRRFCRLKTNTRAAT